MNKRGVVLAIPLLCLSCAAVWSFLPGEPLAGGRRLSEYVLLQWAGPNPANEPAISNAQLLGTNARPLLPGFIACLNDADENVTCVAAAMLGNSRLEPALIRPALETALKDPRARVQAAAAIGLGRLKSTHRPAAE